MLLVSKVKLKSSRVFALCFAMLTCQSASPQGKDECLTLSDLKAKDTTEFVGYGTGTTEQEASQNALVDLSSRIRQKISAASTVTGSNTSVSIKSNSSAMTSQELVGGKILKRCTLGERRFSAVTSLRKELFLTSLQEKINDVLKNADQHVKAIQSASSDIQKNLALAKGKKFLEISK
ncbi:MAG: LPP20 family lipoprotein, partial [Silvanigrellaceae bacterium]|nr:LPP20 family lipoprotein [Silvanigrellaceae bacterium]